MKENITVDELWEYFSEHRKELANEYQVIASDTEQGVEIYIAEEGGFPCFSVEVDGKEVFREKTCSYLDAENTYDRLLTIYLYPDDEYDEYEPDDDDERVREITGAVEDLVTVLVGEHPEDAGISQQEIDEIASVVEQYLYDNLGFSVRHPTVLEDGSVIQYPFGDPDEDHDGVPNDGEIDPDT